MSDESDEEDKETKNDNSIYAGIIGGIIGMAILGGVQLISGFFAKKSKTLDEEKVRHSVGDNNVIIRVLPRMPLKVYRLNKELLLESNNDGLLTINKENIDKIRFWSVNSRNEDVSLFVQKRTGEWVTISKILQGALPNTSTPCRVPFAIFADRFVEVHSFPPETYVPSAAHSQDPNACSVCWANTADTQFLPCAHLSVCWTCTKTLQVPVCIICRKEVTAISYNFKS
eukprot:TRINITY_DN13128_c0_g1_i4.p1 TRINITY_DN13128_c0_g1~~TRINITY_DN13128_c0_g1_i4.p1  ORF type:complete len:228 (+),score=14.78 TRINITY_DN13128_c0_g1_i4:40-723(+)